ncbi:hypothetical protein KF840_24515 [bacterium]|nr:hypothetical protein [bacterium]
MRRLAVAAIAALTLTNPVAAADWNPQAFSGEQTLEFLTVENGEEHWSTVWLVVVDGQVYIRLGSRAAGRIAGNATAPYVKIRIAGQTFDRVRAESVPDMADAVATAMADKYWSDVFVRHFSHPLTMRLTPEAP